MSNVAVVDHETGEIIAPTLFERAEVTKTSLILPDDLQYDEWQQYGEQLRMIEGSVMWWIGDWLNYGEKRYGETYSQALEATEYSYNTLAQAKRIAAAYEPCRRLQSLSWSHHQEALSASDPDAALAEAEAKQLSQKDLRQLIRHEKAGIRERVSPPAGKYSLIYADPPWRYEHVKTESRAIENHYPTMALDEICALPIPEICHDDAVLFMWATSPKLAESMEVLEAWGFTYRTCAVWDKEKIGMGYYFRQQHELLLVATRGSPAVPEPSDRVSSVIRARREEHSKKPALLYELLESMYPHSARIELFCRESRPGWAAWGNQVA